MKNKAILLMGPTATGKTNLALKLAELYPIEIINVDSALIYKDMNIGTAKPTISELSLVTHHLIDILTPLETYSVAQFIKSCNLLIKEINLRGKIPLLVGGTMMYYNALLNGVSVLPEANNLIRAQLEELILKKGVNYLHNELFAVDTVSANKININDRQRIIRALEVYYLSGKPISKLQQDTRVCIMENIEFLSLGILPNERDILHHRINDRFEQMIFSGFIEEVLYLKDKYPELTSAHTSMRCVGYYEVWQYLDNLINKTQLLERGKASTRQLAKRQITWLRNMSFINIVTNGLDTDSLFLSSKKYLEPFLCKA